VDQIKKADVIVVLGAAVRAGGRPSPALRRRVLHAIRLFQKGFSEKLLFTGGIGRYPPSEAQVMRRMAEENGIPDDRIVLEETAGSTLDSAFACTRIIREKGWSTAFVVSDRFLEPFEIVPFDDSATTCFADIRSRAEKDGTPVGPNDLIIAATVLSQKGVLVSNNTKEFQRIRQLNLENWV
jgi:predicted nucleic acid-binding protein